MDFHHTPAVPGVYSITNTATGDQYIGRAKNLRLRAGQHRNLLCKGKHHSAHLQGAWAMHGPDAFRFDVLEAASVKGATLEACEQKWFDLLRPAYNMVHDGSLGGARPGAGRPPHSTAGVKRNTLFRLSPEALEQLDSLTALLGCSRVAIVEDAISDYYHDQRRRSAAVEAAR